MALNPPVPPAPDIAVICVNTECTEHGINKYGPDPGPDAVVICGICLQPCERVAEEVTPR